MNNTGNWPSKLLFLMIFTSVLTQAGCTTPSTQPQKAFAKLDDLGLIFESDHSWLKVGETVHMRFTITNNGSRTWVVESKNFPVLDIIVQDVNSGQLLLSWSAQNPDKVSHRVEWKPGESKMLELTWTAAESNFGHLVHTGGLLLQNSGINQSASVSVCVGYEICH